MRSSRTNRKPAATHHDVILFSVGGRVFGIAAGAVDEIRNLDGLTPFRASFSARLAKVKHTLVRANKDPEQTYFVVDTAAHFRIAHAQPSRLMVLRGVNAVLLVDGIDRMAQLAAIHPLPLAFTGEERRWYRGIAVHGKNVIPVVNEESFLSRAEAATLAAERATAHGVGA